MARPPTGKPWRKIRGFTLSLETIARLKKLAKRHKISMSKTIEKLVAEAEA